MPVPPIGASDLSATPVALLIGFGVLVGIAILFAATALLMVGGYLAFQDDPDDPRPCDAPRGC